MKLDWALRLAGLMDDYEEEGRNVPMELQVEFCRALDILEEAVPTDSSQWPAPLRPANPRAGLKRLRKFEAAYLSAGHAELPGWLQYIGGYIVDRRIEELEHRAAGQL